MVIGGYPFQCVLEKFACDPSEALLTLIVASILQFQRQGLEKTVKKAVKRIVSNTAATKTITSCDASESLERV